MSNNRFHRLHEMVERWATIAEQMESGYALTFDDYLNDVDLRQQIDEQVRTIDEQVRAIDDARNATMPESITVALAAADEQFRRATVVSEENVWGAANERDNGWSAEREWYYYRWPSSPIMFRQAVIKPNRSE